MHGDVPASVPADVTPQDHAALLAMVNQMRQELDHLRRMEGGSTAPAAPPAASRTGAPPQASHMPRVPNPQAHDVGNAEAPREGAAIDSSAQDPAAPFSTMGIPQCDVHTARLRHDAMQQSLAASFTPQINDASASLHRPQRVEEVLLSKGRALQEKRERNAKLLLQAAKAEARKARPTQNSQLFAQRYSERTGQTVADRLYRPTRARKEQGIAVRVSGPR